MCLRIYCGHETFAQLKGQCGQSDCISSSHFPSSVVTAIMGLDWKEGKKGWRIVPFIRRSKGNYRKREKSNGKMAEKKKENEKKRLTHSLKSGVNVQGSTTNHPHPALRPWRVCWTSNPGCWHLSPLLRARAQCLESSLPLSCKLTWQYTLY